MVRAAVLYVTNKRMPIVIGHEDVGFVDVLGSGADFRDFEFTSDHDDNFVVRHDKYVQTRKS